ncbi:MAG: phosphoribosylanthranilate isomerase [Candidatus Methanoplasma sp.]|nr:phosphoribosylanthranilate isomerase [Candidatus Methanoplasma sp.]
MHRDTITVGVFADQSADVICSLVREGTIGMIQLHGSEDSEYIDVLRRDTGVKIVKAFTVRSAEDILAAESSEADIAMLDSGGGTGVTFDWSLARGIRRSFFLAGGLTAGNIAEAVRTVRPYAVDVSSGIETDGIKDRGKIREFMRMVRHTDGEKRT